MWENVFAGGTRAMIHLSSQAELHFNGAHLLLHTYFSDNRYAYTVQKVKVGMPVALCEERFKSAQAAMRKAEEVAARALGVKHVTVEWRPTKAVVSREEPSRIVELPLKPKRDINKSAG